VAAIKRVSNIERAFFTVISGSLGSDGSDGIAGHLMNAGDILGGNGIALAISDERSDGGEQFANAVHQIILGEAFIREVI
jgi:hypothetical protein